MTDVINPSWDAQLAESDFPFVDDSSLVDVSGAVTLPRGVVRDIELASALLNTPLYLYQVVRDALGVELRFAGGQEIVGIVRWDAPETGWTEIADPQGIPCGQIRTEATVIATLFGWQVGTYRFDPQATTLVPWTTSYRPLAGFRGLQLPDGTILGGQVTIIAGEGLEFDAQGHLSVVGTPQDIPQEGLIPRGIRKVVLDDQGDQQTVDPQGGIITGRTTNPTGRAPLTLITSPQSNKIRVEVRG